MTATLSLPMSTTVIASKQQISCDVADEIVVLSVENGQYYGLNPVGASIWRLIQSPRTLDELRDRLLAEYDDVSDATCTAEVVAFMTDMLALGLVQRV